MNLKIVMEKLKQLVCPSMRVFAVELTDTDFFKFVKY